LDNVEHVYAGSGTHCFGSAEIDLVLQIDTEEGQKACDELGIDVIPTVQFWKNNVKLWEHKGIVGLGDDLGQG